MNEKLFLVSNAKMGIHLLAKKRNEIEEDSLRVNLLNKITIIYRIFEGFFPSEVLTCFSLLCDGKVFKNSMVVRYVTKTQQKVFFLLRTFRKLSPHY